MRWLYQGRAEPVSQDAEALHPDAWARTAEIPVLRPRQLTPHPSWCGVTEASLITTPGMDTWFRGGDSPVLPSRRSPVDAVRFVEPIAAPAASFADAWARIAEIPSRRLQPVAYQLPWQGIVEPSLLVVPPSEGWSTIPEIPTLPAKRPPPGLPVEVHPVSTEAGVVFHDAWARLPEIPVRLPSRLTPHPSWGGVTEASLIVTPTSEGWARTAEVPVLPARRAHPGLPAEVHPISSEEGPAFADAWAKLPEIPVRLTVRLTPHLPWGGVSEPSLFVTPPMDSWYRATEIPTIPLPHHRLNAMIGEIESMGSSAPPADVDFPAAYRPSRADVSDSENDRRPRANVE